MLCQNIITPRPGVKLFLGAVPDALALVLGLFRGRSDIVAKAYEFTNKKGELCKGYAPICLNRGVSGACPKTNNSKTPCRTCPSQAYIGINGQLLADHFAGKLTLGVYPLLPDGTTWWIAADLDNHTGGANPHAALLKIATVLRSLKLPHYALRSRSGAGHHLYLFFSTPVQAWKARAVFGAIVKQAGILGDAASGFDRFFPSQDSLPDPKSPGNLISLSFQGKAMVQGNTLFLDPDSQFTVPYADQVSVLKTIERIAEATLDALISTMGLTPSAPVSALRLGPSKTIESANVPAKASASHAVTKCDFPPADASKILGACAFCADCVVNSITLTEPAWYAFLSIIARCENGRSLCHEYSSPYPNYGFDETERKIDHALNSTGPRTCENIRATCGGEEFCAVCPHFGKVKSPILLGYEPGALKAFFAPVFQRVQHGSAVAVNSQGELKPSGSPDVPQLSRQGVLLAHAENLCRQGAAPDAIRTALHAENLAKCNPPLEVQEVEELADKIIHQQQGFGNDGGTIVESVIGADVCVPGLVIPAKYTITQQGHIVTVTKGPKGVPVYITVSTAFMFIKALYIDMGTGLSSVELALLENGTIRSIIVERHSISDTKASILLSNLNLPIHVNNAKLVIQYLADFIAANQHRLPTHRCTSKLGWQGDSGIFMLGRTMIAKTGTNPQPITFKGRDVGDEQIAAGYHKKGTLEGWIEAFDLIKRFPIPLFYLLVALSVLFMKKLKCANKVVDNCKRNSTGKSISLENSISAFGNPVKNTDDTCLLSWDTTPVALGRILSVVNHMPLFVDDTKDAKDADFISSTLYSVAAGRDKMRGTTKGLAFTGTCTTIMLTNGEQPAVSFAKNHGGAHARTLTIQAAPFGNDQQAKLVKKVRSIVGKHYGHVAPMIAQFIADHDEDDDMWEAALEDAKDYYADQAEGDAVADRMSDLFALVATTAPLIFKAVPQMQLEMPISQLLEDIWQHLEHGAQEADRPLEAFKVFWDWAARNPRKFFSPKKKAQDEEGTEQYEPTPGWYGRWDDTARVPYIAVTRTALEKALKDAGYDLNAVIDAWADNKWLWTRNDGKRQRTVSIAKANVACYCFRLETIEEVLNVEEVS